MRGESTTGTERPPTSSPSRCHETHPDLIITAHHAERGELCRDRTTLSFPDFGLDRVEDLVRTRELESSHVALGSLVRLCKNVDSFAKGKELIGGWLEAKSPELEGADLRRVDRLCSHRGGVAQDDVRERRTAELEPRNFDFALRQRKICQGPVSEDDRHRMATRNEGKTALKCEGRALDSICPCQGELDESGAIGRDDERALVVGGLEGDIERRVIFRWAVLVHLQPEALRIELHTVVDDRRCFGPCHDREDMAVGHEIERVLGRDTPAVLHPGVGIVCPDGTLGGLLDSCQEQAGAHGRPASDQVRRFTGVEREGDVSELG